MQGAACFAFVKQFQCPHIVYVQALGDKDCDGTTPTETSRGGFTAEDIYQYQWLVKFVDNKVVVNSYGDYYLLNYVGSVAVD